MNRVPLVLLALAVALASFWAMSDLPFFSEDFTQLLEKGRLDSLGQALDPALEPLRPLQHLPFFVLSRSADPDPAWLRGFALLVHLGSVCLVVRLAGSLGAGARDARLAGALFLVYPCARALVWGAAISTPLRVFFLLGALVAFAERRTLLLVLAFVLALASHESAVVLPLLLVLYAWTRGALARLREPAFLIVLALGLAHLVYVGLLRPQRHHGLKALDALPANLVKAALALFPEPVRVFCLDGLRGIGGPSVLLLACFCLWAWALLLGWALRSGSGSLRFLVLAIAADFVLPVLGAGFGQRYACLAGGFAAIGLVLVGAELGRGARMALLGSCFVAWSLDSAGDYAEYRAAGELQRRILVELREERARAGPGEALAVVDLPDLLGREHDLPFFNWGAEQCLLRAGIPGPWVLWRTHRYRTGSDIPEVPPARVQEVRGQGVKILVFDAHSAGDELRSAFRR